MECKVQEDALLPVRAKEKKWKWFEVSNLWANDIQSLFGYTLVASLFISYGVSGWTAFAALIVASLIVMYFVNLSGKAGVEYGIAYPVLARASMGIKGSKLPAIIRAIVAVFWFGVQTYFASTALKLLLVSLFEFTSDEKYLGLSFISWISFLIVWFLQMVIFSKGMSWVSKFLNFAGPFVYLVMIALLVVLISKSNGDFFSSVNTIFLKEDISIFDEINGFIAIVGTMIAYFSAVMINFSDFSRYIKDEKSMKIGNFVGLPLNMLLFAALALFITAGTTLVFNEQIINPSLIVEKANNTQLSIIAAITFFAATVGINLIANFIPAVNGISNLAPKKLNFKKSGMIVSTFAFFIGAFWSAFISEFNISIIVNILGATLAPLYGIMIADYYLLRKQKLNIKALYDDSKASEYYYEKGWNKNALLAFFIASVFSVMSIFVEELSSLSGYAWIIGVFLSGFLYLFFDALQAKKELSFQEA